MHRKNLKSDNRRRPRQAGQVLVETALILLVFVMTLVAALDFSQILFTHQMLVERVRIGLRYGMIHAWDGTGDDVANMIMYNTPHPKPGVHLTYPVLTRDNIQVTQMPGSVADPNDLRVQVRIVNYKFKFFTPLLAKTVNASYMVSESAPILHRN